MQRFLFFIILSLFCGALAIQACQVPVFRYALERWEADAYLVTITPPQQGLTTAEQAVVDLLKASSKDANAPANLEVIVSPPNASLSAPTLELFYPRKLRGVLGHALWSGSLTRENAESILDSPVRAELRKRILKGESAVWVLVESGNATADDEAAGLLDKISQEAESILKLPDGVITPDEALARGPHAQSKEDDILASSLPLKVDFSLLKVSRKDPKEAVLLSMLLNLEDDLGDYAQEPMAFPVFGRGRALEPLIGKGIHRDNLLEHSTYLCGACSCEVKDQNPGIDLLLAAGWDAILSDQIGLEDLAKPLTVKSDPLPAETAIPSDSGKTQAPSRTVLIWLAALLLLLGAGRLLRRGRGPA